MPISRIYRSILTGVAVAVLAGCQTYAPAGQGNWTTVRPAKAPVAHAVNFAHPVRFVANDAVLLADQAETLNRFLSRVQPKGSDTVTIKAHPGMIDAARAQSVRGALAPYGVTASDRPADDGQPVDVVRVEVRTHVVTLPGCPDWTAHPSRTFDNQPTSNFGCATAQNFGLMVADPADLVAGRRIGPADGAVQAAAVDRYRKGETKPLLGDGTTETSGGVTTGGN